MVYSWNTGNFFYEDYSAREKRIEIPNGHSVMNAHQGKGYTDQQYCIIPADNAAWRLLKYNICRFVKVWFET